jgi:hypothetical protein
MGELLASPPHWPSRFIGPGKCGWKELLTSFEMHGKYKKYRSILCGRYFGDDAGGEKRRSSSSHLFWVKNKIVESLSLFWDFTGVLGPSILRRAHRRLRQQYQQNEEEVRQHWRKKKKWWNIQWNEWKERNLKVTTRGERSTFNFSGVNSWMGFLWEEKIIKTNFKNKKWSDFLAFMMFGSEANRGSFSRKSAVTTAGKGAEMVSTPSSTSRVVVITPFSTEISWKIKKSEREKKRKEKKESETGSKGGLRPIQQSS